MKRKLLLCLLLSVSMAAFSQGYRPMPDRERELDKKYTSGLFSQTDADYFDFETDPTTHSAIVYGNVLDWLQGRVAGLQVYTYRNTKIPVIRNRPAAIYVDEMRMDPGFLNVLPVADIALIKVMKTPTALLWGAPGGAIAIYTRHGGNEEEPAEEAAS